MSRYRIERWEKDAIKRLTPATFSRSAFDRYVKVQNSGKLNMYDSRVQNRASLSRVEHLYILLNYSRLHEYFSKTEEEEE